MRLRSKFRGFPMINLLFFNLSRSHNLNLIAKMMKELPGDFREDARLDEMTVNELVFYRDILPTYEKLLIASGGKVKAEWTPKFYYGIYGFNEGQNEIFICKFRD